MYATNENGVFFRTIVITTQKENRTNKKVTKGEKDNEKNKSKTERMNYQPNTATQGKEGKQHEP